MRSNSTVTVTKRFFPPHSAFSPWEASNRRLPPSRAAFYCTCLSSGQGVAPWFLGVGSMPWPGSCALVLTVSESLVSHDMACPRVSPALPRAPRPHFFLHPALWQPWLSRGVWLQALKGKTSSVAAILVLDKRPGEVNGAL